MFSKNIEKGLFSTEEIYEFIYDARYIILLYVIGDFLTTFHALSNGYGFEENGFLSGIMASHGIWSLLVVKMLILLVIYWNYRSVRTSVHSYARKLWDISRMGISLFGLVLVINNLMVITVRSSLFEYLGLS
ncbi:DUF5658 family protein [Methanolobus profundi]|uniref:DUF5658 domain-containing protein n=1 Tax=Methanolobus profundi TaxID=487685 RepID=A0A1I4PD91_9EURY|nr:DUF5658 family protein [Methanolobus profundi]SFM25637.1 hypothetical protein SAMN04488696_0583 [Methanolobus profundi]